MCRLAPVVFALSLLTSFAYAQPQSADFSHSGPSRSREQVVQPVNESILAPIGGAQHPRATARTDRGVLPDDFPLDHVQFLLNRPAERQAALDKLLVDLHTPGNPRFHKWLTPEQVGEQFGPAPADIAKLTGWLEGHGFRVNAVVKSGTIVDFSGTNALLRNTFHTEMHNIQLANGEKHFSSMGTPRVPAALASFIAGFASLSDFRLQPQHIDTGKIRRYKDGHVEAEPETGVQPDITFPSGTETLYSVGASDFYTIYDETPLFTRSTPIKGTGQTVIVAGRSTVTAADFTTFRTQFGVSGAGKLATQIGTSGVACSSPGLSGNDDESEASLDVQWAGAAAPDASIILVACMSTNTTDGATLAAEGAVDGNLGDVLNVSFSAPENTLSASGLQFYNNLWQQAAAQGMTVVVSTGDADVDLYDSAIGSYFDTLNVAYKGANVNALASTPYDVAVGGTDFQAYPNYRLNGNSDAWLSNYWNTGASTASPWESAKSYIPETTWNATCANSMYDAEQVAENVLSSGENSPFAACQEALVTYVNTGMNSLFADIVGASGGFSSSYARPGWQAGVYGLASSGNSTMRGLPDVSLFSSSGFFHSKLMYCDSGLHGGCTYSSNNANSYDSANSGGGTSFAAPQMSGIMALIGQATGERQGQANYVLYALAGKQYGSTSYTGTSCLAAGTTVNNGSSPSASYLPASSCTFHDVATGNIDVPCYGGAGSGATGSGDSTDCFAPAENLVTIQNTQYRFGALSASATAWSPLYPAASGWDPATGLGSVDIANLVENWSGATGSPSFAAAVTLTDTGVAGKTYTYGTLPSASALAAVVTGNGSTPTGTVTFQGSGAIGTLSSTATTPSGCPGTSCEAKASSSFVPAQALPAATYNLTATFTGGEDYASATSSPVTFTVAQQTPVLGTPSFSPTSVAYGSSTAVTVTVKLGYTGVGSAPTGTVSYAFRGSTYNATCSGSSSPLLCTATIPASTIGALPVGQYPVSASYLGNVNYAAVQGAAAYLNVTVKFTESALYAFSDAEGYPPEESGLIQASDGNLYGYGNSGSAGAIYAVSLAGTHKLVASFEAADGTIAGPYGPVGELLEGPDGNFYGVTQFDNKETGSAEGAVFKMTPDGTITTLHLFCQQANCTDGNAPDSSLILGYDGLLYGIAGSGGANGYGVVYRISTSGTYKAIYSFANGGERYPAKLVQATDNNFYGVEEEVFIYQLTPAGVYTQLVQESAANSGGAIAYGALVEGADGALYGANSNDFTKYYGNVFRLTTDGDYSNLYYFTAGDQGGNFNSALTVGSDGYFYGTTSGGGSASEGETYRISENGTFSAISSECAKANCSDGYEFYNTPIQGSDGAFYGVADSGGPEGQFGDGLIYKLSSNGAVPPPVQLSFSTSSAPVGDTVTLNWQVLNAFSLTAQQCYAYVQGNAAGAGTWTGGQGGLLVNGVYYGSASITPTAAGTYTYALTCGGSESGFATFTAGGKTTTSLVNTGTAGSIAAGRTGLIGVEVVNAYKPTGNVTYSVPGLGNLAVLPVQSTGATGNYGAPTVGYPPGTYNITAAYAGDANNSPSSLTYPLTITPNVLMTASANPSAVSAGQTVTFTAQVQPNGYQGPTVTGTVTFSVDGINLGSAQVSSTGYAVLSFAVPSGYSPGRYTLNAAYAPAAGSSYPAASTTFTVTLN